MPGTVWKAAWISGRRKDRSAGTTANWRTRGNHCRAQRGQMPWETRASPGSPAEIVVPHQAHTARMVAGSYPRPQGLAKPFLGGIRDFAQASKQQVPYAENASRREANSGCRPPWRVSSPVGAHLAVLGLLWYGDRAWKDPRDRLAPAAIRTKETRMSHPLAVPFAPAHRAQEPATGQD